MLLGSLFRQGFLLRHSTVRGAHGARRWTMLRGSYKNAEAAPDKFSFQAGFTPLGAALRRSLQPLALPKAAEGPQGSRGRLRAARRCLHARRKAIEDGGVHKDFAKITPRPLGHPLQLASMSETPGRLYNATCIVLWPLRNSFCRGFCTGTWADVWPPWARWRAIPPEISRANSGYGLPWPCYAQSLQDRHSRSQH